MRATHATAHRRLARAAFATVAALVLFALVGLPEAQAADPPTITGLAPNSGSIAGGTQVTISGTDFTGATEVTFDGLPVSFTLQNDTTMIAPAPAHAAGTVDVAVTTAGGTSANTADDDFTYLAVGVTVTESAGATAVLEAGPSDTYTMVLIGAPTDTVTITISVPGDVSLDQAALTFTTGNWSTPQTVTVTAIDDAVIEGVELIAIQHTATGGGYTGVQIADVLVTVTDNDVAGVQVVESGSATTVTEGGANDTYTVVLTTQPASTVTITVNGTAQASVSPTLLSFSSGNWNAPQTVTVSAIDDGVLEGAHATTISHTAAGAGFDGLNIANVIVQIVDNDAVSGEVQITESGGVTLLAEGGGADTYTVVLTAQPSGPVTVTVTAAAGQAFPNVAMLLFTTSDWNIAQTVSLTAVDDAIVEGVHSATVVHTAIGGGYTGVAIDNVVATITDNDAPGVILPAGDAAAITFTATDDAFVRADDPTKNFGGSTRVEIDGSPVKEGLLKFSLSGLAGRTITSATLQLFVRDSSDRGGRFFATLGSAWNEATVTWNTAPAASGLLIADLGRVSSGEWVDIDLSALVVRDGPLSLRVRAASDNAVHYASREHQGGQFAPRLIVRLAAAVGPTVAEGGAAGSYTVALASQPAGNVTITIAANAQVLVSPAQLVFTPATWSAPQRVTVTAVDDDIVEGPHSTALTHTAIGPGYTGLAIPKVTVQITDNDISTLVITESAGATAVTEGGADDSYTVALGSQPSGTVTVTLSPSAEITVNPTVLTFTSANWSAAQSVTVSAIDDSTVEGDRSGTIAHTASGGGFGAAVVATVLVTVADNDRTETIALPAGLELIGWFGVPTTSRAILDANARIITIWAWDHASESWLVDSRFLPNSLRVTIAITRGRGFFVVTSAPTSLDVLVAT